MNKRPKKLTLQVVFLVQVLLCQGCNIFGFLANPGPFEQNRPPDFKLKSIADKKILVWVEAMPGSGASSEVAGRLHHSIQKRLIKNVKISKKHILTQDPFLTPAYNPNQRPEEIGRQVGAGAVLYVRLESFEAVNLHSNTIFSGQMKARAFLIRSEDGEILCPQEPTGIVADVMTEMASKGRGEIVMVLSDAAAHCIVRHFYPCPTYEYQVNEERSILNEMIRRDVY